MLRRTSLSRFFIRKLENDKKILREMITGDALMHNPSTKNSFYKLKIQELDTRNVSLTV
ncbi:hypothetical protein [Brassicibacter mesophilus]|uniref:hypothetical protein n=1 Tax=Brassicibacter mesophilus TaxID=745119 RepID=UPI003D20D3F0